MKFTEEQKKKLYQLYNEYPNRKDLRKIKTEIDGVKIARQYLKFIKPFLQFVELKDLDFKDEFKDFLDDSDFNKLYPLFDIFDDDIEYGKDDARDKIRNIINEKLSNINELYALIFYLISEEREKSKEVSLSEFKFETKKPEKIEKPKPKKEKKKSDKPNPSD